MAWGIGQVSGQNAQNDADKAAKQAARAAEDAANYQYGMASQTGAQTAPFIGGGTKYFNKGMKGMNNMLRQDWLAPMRGAREAAMDQTTARLGRAGLGESGIANASQQNVDNNWANSIAEQAIAANQAKAGMYGQMGQQGQSAAMQGMQTNLGAAQNVNSAIQNRINALLGGGQLQQGASGMQQKFGTDVMNTGVKVAMAMMGL